MPHPIDFFYQHAGKALRPYMNVEPATEDDFCGVCERNASQWLDPLEKVSFKQYGVSEVHCVCCHSLYEGSLELFGVERLAKGTPVPMKLGMATGCGALITPKQTTLYLNGFIRKMEKAPKPPFPMLELSGKAAHLSIIANPPADQQYLYIGNFGRKKRDLVSNLRLSSPTTLYICEESTCTEVNIAALQALRDASEGVPEAMKTATRRTLMDVYTGRLAPDDDRVIKQLQQVGTTTPQLVPAIRALPVDPHQILNLLRMW